MLADQTPKIAIGVPYLSQVEAMWAHDYARMLAWMAQVHPKIEVTAMFCGGSLIVKQRDTILKAVLADSSFTHLLWCDTDMRFPANALDRLLSDRCPAVGVNYTRRNPPYYPTAFTPGWEPLYTEVDSKGLERAGAVGCGLFLIELAEVRRMKKPYFMVAFNPETGTFIGEDAFFCTKLAELGIPVMVDHDLTKECLHTGRVELTFEYALKQRELNKQAEEATA